MGTSERRFINPRASWHEVHVGRDSTRAVVRRPHGSDYRFAFTLVSGRASHCESINPTYGLGHPSPGLGDEHRTTLSLAYSLAKLYELRGKHFDAEPLFVRTLQGIRQVLGDEHPQTLYVMDGLAGHYQLQGNDKEAEALYAEALSISRRLLGASVTSQRRLHW